VRSEIVTVCQDIANSMDEGVRKIAAPGVDSRVVVLVRKFFVGRSQRVRVTWGTLGERVGPTSVPRVHKCYLEELGINY